MIATKTLAMKCVKIVENKKAQDVVVLDVKGLSSITDYFVICTATSDRQVRTIVEELHKEMKKEGILSFHKDGLKEYTWVVIDFIDVIAHVFLSEVREFYDLESLWGDAKKVYPVQKKTTKKSKPATEK